MRLGAIVTMAVVITVTSLQAQQNLRFRGSSMWGTGSKYEMLFDKFNVQSFQGKITKIDTLTPIRGMSYGVVMTVQSGSDERVVHLGPGWYIMYQDMNIGINDEVEINGAQASIDGKQFVMAVSVSKKDKILVLRDEDGIPYWISYRSKLK